MRYRKGVCRTLRRCADVKRDKVAAIFAWLLSRLEFKRDRLGDECALVVKLGLNSGIYRINRKLIFTFGLKSCQGVGNGGGIVLVSVAVMLNKFGADDLTCGIFKLDLIASSRKRLCGNGEEVEGDAVKGHKVNVDLGTLGKEEIVIIKSVVGVYEIAGVKDVHHPGVAQKIVVYAAELAEADAAVLVNLNEMHVRNLKRTRSDGGVVLLTYREFVVDGVMRVTCEHDKVGVS